MTCGGCAISVESMLKSVDGVKNAGVNFADQAALVESILSGKRALLPSSALAWRDIGKPNGTVCLDYFCNRQHFPYSRDVCTSTEA